MSTTKYISWGQVKQVEAEKAKRAQASRPSNIEQAPAQDMTVAPDATVASDTTVAPRATVAREHGSPWHGATVAPDATVAPLATVRTVPGYWNLSNTVVDSLWQ